MSYLDSIKLFVHPRVITRLFLGFSAGIPILLIFSTLGLWLNEAGVAKSSITFFSWAALGYSFKFVWAPLVDRLPLPVLTKLLGRRRSWMLISQLAIMSSIWLMSSVDPQASVDNLTIMAIGAVLLGFSSATQDIVIDAYRIESADKDMQSMLSATYIAGYRIGMLAAGAGGLFLASYFGSTKELYSFSAWSNTYLVMIMVMSIGVATTLVIQEPKTSGYNKEYSTKDYLRFFALFLTIVAAFIATFVVSADIVKTLKSSLTEAFSNKHLSGFIVGTLRMMLAIVGAVVAAKILIALNIVNRSMVNNTYVDPVKDFFGRYGLSVALLLLAVVGLYRISDIVLGVVANIFYQDMGFTKIEIATVSKTFGLFMTIAGGFLGGLMAIKFGVFRVLFLGALLSALTNLLFIVLASVGHDMTWLYITITMDNLSAGLAGAAFIAFLSSLTNIKFTAVQYAIFSSLMTLLPKIFGGYSGTLVDGFGYSAFFVITTLVGIPVLILVYMIKDFDKSVNIAKSVDKSVNINYQYGGFWIRVAAWCIDGLVLLIPLLFFQLLNVHPFSLYLLAISIAWLYSAALHSSSWQATVGKKIFKLQVIDGLHGGRISFGRATARYFLTFISSIFLIGYIIVGVTRNKQAFHDLIAKTYVIKKEN